MAERNWRLIVEHNPYTDFSISVSPAVERAVAAGEAPPTVLLNVFDRDSITIGVNEDPLQVVDMEYCRAEGIEVRRRVNGGGAIYAGAGSVFMCFYLPTALEGVPQTAREAFPQVLSSVARTLEARYGFPARYRPLNDVEVDGRKLMPTSVKIEDGVMTLRVLLNVRAIDADVAAKALPMPPEKVKDKVHKELKSRYTWLEREAGRAIAPDELETAIRQVTADAFGPVDLKAGTLTAFERETAERLAAELGSDDWLFGKSEHVLFGPLKPGETVLRGRAKAVGGLIWAALKLRDGVVSRAIVNGDWHPRPTDSVAWLEAALAGCPAQGPAIEERVRTVLAREDVEFAGIEPEDLMAAFEKALAGMESDDASALQRS
ncbi:lipoate--protein ligase family protein [Kaustia mangrovi]|uniref:Lipoate--protein ligase family protein n=1 Tax=Kaustia mangrovi TaxID=2593653 RepID=A0A7S8C4B6_9HYPH|nr:hypothetical protein [Kaustia mangrovi]QPC43106.1 lipoate--protein ligase family protein [Kaustia mangrovi]